MGPIEEYVKSTSIVETEGKVAPYVPVPECYGTIGSQMKGCPIKDCEIAEACGRIAATMEPMEADGKLLIPDHAPKCYGKPELIDDSECDACEVLDLCMAYVAIVENLEEPLASDSIPEPPKRPDYGVIDKNTGEVVQLSLLGAEWEQYKVETLRLSLSGGDEFIKAMFDQLVDGELSPGSIVEVVCRGVVKEHAPIFKKDGHEGKTVIVLEVVREITVLGHMTAKVEAAQNVDGEAKVMEEADPEPEPEPQMFAKGEADAE